MRTFSGNILEEVREIQKERNRIRNLLAMTMSRDYEDIYSPKKYMYDKFNREPPERVKSRARERLEWFVIVVMGLLCGWILYVDKGGMR